MSTDFFRDLKSEEPYKLKDGELKFWSSFTNPEFDNDDSEFAEIRLHYMSSKET